MTAGVLEHLAVLAEAPGGVERLRALILSMAVTGQLAGGTAVRTGAPTDELPALPAAWRYVPFNDLIDPARPIAYGVLVPGPEIPGGVPFVRIADLSLNSPAALPEKTIAPAVDAQYSRTRLHGGEILMGVVGSVGKLGIAPPSWAGANIARAICRIVPKPGVARDFVVLLLQSSLMRQQFLSDTRTLAQPTLNVGLIRTAWAPLPPLAEQHRIVAKVDELMALCDRLEARQQDAEAAHARLVQTLLDSLAQARDADEFQACWQRVAGQIQALLTTDASVERLEAVVLQLAVTGRLTGHGKAFEAPADDAPDLPPLATGWAYRAFNDLIDPERPIAYGVLVPGPEVADGVPFVRIADLSLQSPAALPEKSIAREVDAKFSRTRLVGGEILMGVVGSVGKLGIAPASWAGANIARAICRIVPAQGVNKDYVLLLLRSELMRCQFLGDTRTLAQPTLNVGLIRAAKAPVPPLAEQAQVVRAAHELLTLCDQLKARLAAARAKHAQLAEALVAQAVAA